MKEGEQKRLADILYYSKNKQKDIQYLMRKNHLPFLATDRNVLNLPAIGKSMTFETIGITAEGKRILRFDHDHGAITVPSLIRSVKYISWRINLLLLI